MNNKEYTVSEVIDSFGMNKHTWLMFMMLALAMILDGYDFMVVNSTNMFVAHTFWPDNPNPGALMGSLTTWGLLGMVIGGAIGGILSDRIGRKKMLIIAVMFYGFFTLPQAFSNDLAFFAAFRLIAGLGVGSCIPIVTTVFAETMPSKHRGLFIACGQACMVGGWVVAGLVANPICNAEVPLLGDFTNAVTYIATTAAGETVEQTMYANWRLCYRRAERNSPIRNHACNRCDSLFLVHRLSTGNQRTIQTPHCLAAYGHRYAPPLRLLLNLWRKTAGKGCGKEVSETSGTERLIEPKRGPSLGRASALCVFSGGETCGLRRFVLPLTVRRFLTPSPHYALIDQTASATRRPRQRAPACVVRFAGSLTNCRRSLDAAGNPE